MLCKCKERAANRVEFIRPEGFYHPVLPCSLSILDNKIYSSLSPSIYPSLSLPSLKKNSRQSPSSDPPLLSTYVRSLLLYLRSASINHYLPSSILFIKESPPTFPPAERPHCHQSASRLLSREIGICSLLHFSLCCLLHPLSLHL